MTVNFRNTVFIESVFDPKKLFRDAYPEVAFIGRSNVGKSSLLNCLVGRKEIAKVSQTPGKTRSVNYFLIDNSLYFVDLPGFGYAKRAKSELRRFETLIEKYFIKNEKIILVCHLIDSRIPPTELDITANDFIMKLNYPSCILLTKVDKLKQSEKAGLRKELKNLQLQTVIETINFSSKTGEGKKEVLSLIGMQFENYFKTKKY
ncbi:MAG: YihA family ribosome biogenesis GTP-binding protein [Ignavibacteria bacterium]|nr:YihA family ribosome biogenesis GTP-binding protein [Ignavibacteria bacterium]